MDLHAWITQQVEQAEACLLDQVMHRRVAFTVEGQEQRVTGTVTGVTRTGDWLQLDIAQYGVGAVDETFVPVQPAMDGRRRCEADRRILARHRADLNCTYERPCLGCGTYGDFDLANVDDINDCPELLDLAHAYGATPELLAGLDRWQPPEPVIDDPEMLARRERFAAWLDALHDAASTSTVPATLRGPRWTA